MTGPDDLRVVDVDNVRANAFLRYAREFGAVHDDSYVTDEDLAGFDPSREPAAWFRTRAGNASRFNAEGDTPAFRAATGQ